MRNWTFTPGAGFIVLAGPNGAGKSNLLEGIYYLGAGYPYRQVHDEALVCWGADFFVIRGCVLQNGLKYDLEIAYQPETRRKIIKINGKRSLPGACAAYLPVVIFSPGRFIVDPGSACSPEALFRPGGDPGQAPACRRHARLQRYSESAQQPAAPGHLPAGGVGALG